MARELAVIVAGALMPGTDTTIVSIGVTALMEAFGVTEAAVQWVFTSYLLALAVAIPLTGWADERFGGRRCWHVGLWASLVGSVLCALSPTLPALVASRAVQGFAAGMLITLMTSLPVEMARARGIVALLLAFTGVSQGADLLAAEVMAPLAVRVASVAAFCLLPATHDPERALIDISLMRVRSISAASAAMFCAGCVLYSTQFLLPLFWQELMGCSVLEAALLLIPQGVGALMSRTLAGRLTDSHGARSWRSCCRARVGRRERGQREPWRSGAPTNGDFRRRGARRVGAVMPSGRLSQASCAFAARGNGSYNLWV